jgi:DUF2075 family protein/predicted GIY-YIG superfamily endonuclease/SOS-response transcriptional repressor LexA
MSNKHRVEVNQHPFKPESLTDIARHRLAGNQWPLVYVLSNDKSKSAYVGETTDALNRMSTHLKHKDKSKLTTLHLVSSESFNKSATLDIESNLIKYMAADGKFNLLNGNLGLADHNYYQREEVYHAVFKNIWDKLRSVGVAQHSLESIDNSDLFKYSPYKTLSSDQRQGLLGIMYALVDQDTKHLIVEGGAGTGKTILAIFLFKLLLGKEEEFDFKEFSSEEEELRNLLDQTRSRYPQPKMALVIPMASFRKTLKKAFGNISGLNGKMVIGPSELSKQQYDIVIVDESHRLRKRVNLGAYFGAFDKACEALGFDKYTTSEVHWVKKQSSKAVFFYDQNQSIKPSDANQVDFLDLKDDKNTQVQTLVSQFRVHGGNPYVQFIEKLLAADLESSSPYNPKNYEFKLFESIHELIEEVQLKNQRVGLSRLIAGYSWKWVSNKDATLYDIKIDGAQLRWNSTATDWINSNNADKEVGCIHTTQGYDLNYAGVIFGEEIDYDPKTNQLIIINEKYFDQNGKQSIKDPDELKRYILNIYKTIMLRGIRGTFLYACNKNLRDYLAKHVPFTPRVKFPVAEQQEIIPFENAVPLFDLQAAAGNFSELQKTQGTSDLKWIAVPESTHITEQHFACRVVGESMNKIIPNDSICLFRNPSGGSRNGKIVLVERSKPFDEDIGSCFTVKEYESFKYEDENGWSHQKILLKPRSLDPSYEILELTEEKFFDYKVVGEFVAVLS